MASTTPSCKPFDIAIIGGGISGLTLAIALLQHNIPLTIYESAARFGEIGAGVAFGPNATLAMSLISPKIHAAFEKCKTANQWPSKAGTWFTVRVGDARRGDKDGYVREGVKVGDALFDMQFGNDRDRGGVYRAHFLDELVKEIPEGVAQFGKKLVNMSRVDDGSGDIVCHFADGTQARHNAVIGCDGIKSATRQWLLSKDDPASHPVFSGKYAYRGLIPMNDAINMLGDEVAQNSQMYFGYGGHVLTFPIEKGKTMNVVAFSSCPEWKDEKWVVTTSKEDMMADYASWGPLVRKIINSMQKPDVWALFYHLPCSSYYKGRVCLLGDAAHATTPHQGAGAGMCMEDVLLMSVLLQEAQKVGDLEKAFDVYDEVRRERSQKNVATSLEAGTLYDFELEGDDLDRIASNYKSRMAWIWNIDLEKEVERARMIYRNGRSKM